MAGSLLEVPCCEDKVQQSNAFVSLMMQEESDQLEELLENDSDGGDELDEEVEVEEEEEDAVDVVEDEQRTDEIQNKEGNEDGDDEQWNKKQRMENKTKDPMNNGTIGMEETSWMKK